MLSLAGCIGMVNKHFYKTSIQRILASPNIFDDTIDDICNTYELTNHFDTIPSAEIGVSKDALLAAISLKTTLSL